MIQRAKAILDALPTDTVLRVLVVVSSIACFASLASAAVLSGTFSGTALAGGSFLSLPAGTPVTGSFKLDLDYPFELSNTDGMTYANYEAANFEVPPDPVHFTFSASSLGYDWDYDALGFLNVYLRQTANSQSITFSTYFPKGSGAEITLSGAAGALFQNLALSSVHSGPVSLNESFAHFDQTAGIGNSIVFNRLSFDAPPVPEPASSLLLLAGLGVLRIRDRQKCKQR